MKEHQLDIGERKVFFNSMLQPPILVWRRKHFYEYLWAKILELHQKGIEGDQQAVQEGVFLLEKFRQAFPDNHLIEAYYGSIIALQGRDAVDPMERLEKVRQGLKYLDDAVRNEPENKEIRIVRAYVCFHLPEVFFHRTSMAAEDFLYLINCYEKDANTFSKELYGQLLHDLITAYQTLGRDQDSRLIQEKLKPEHGTERREHQ